MERQVLWRFILVSGEDKIPARNVICKRKGWHSPSTAESQCRVCSKSMYRAIKRTEGPHIWKVILWNRTIKKNGSGLTTIQALVKFIMRRSWRSGLSGYQILVLLQRLWVWLPSHTMSSLQPPTIPTPVIGWPLLSQGHSVLCLSLHWEAISAY